MVIDFHRQVVQSADQSLLISLAGNFSDHFPFPFAHVISESFHFDPDQFILPLPVQFRKGDSIYLWIDWTEAATNPNSPDSQIRIQLTLLDRIFQACNEICRHTNEYSIQIQGADLAAKSFLDTLVKRCSPAFEITFSPD